MDHRIGTCAGCGARFQIPASFAPSRAKCRTCGGVVEIASAPAPAGAEAHAAPAPAPAAAAPAPAPGPERAPAPRPAPAAMPAQPASPARRSAPAGAPGPKPRRWVLPLVAAAVIALLALGAWGLFG